MSAGQSAVACPRTSGWATTVGAICVRFGGEVQTGPFGSQLHAADYSEVGTPVVMPQDMQDGRIVTSRIARVDSTHVKRLKQHKLCLGDIVYSRRGDIGRFAVVSEGEVGWLCGTGSIRIRLNCPDIDIAYARRYLQQGSVATWLGHHAKGVTMPNLNTTVIRALPFVYPPLPEQRRIAEILDKADALRSKRRAALAELDTLSQSIFLDMFGDPATNPKGWPNKSLGHVLEVEWGNTSITKERYVEHGVPAYSASGFDGFLPEAEHEGEGIVLSAIGARCGKCFYVPAGPWTAIKNTITMRPKAASPIELRYIMRLVNNEKFWRTRGAGQPFIGLGTARSQTIPVPPVELQRTFSRTVEAVDSVDAAFSRSQTSFDALFTSLQHRAFRGDL